MNRVGVMTCALNEVACSVFSVAAFVDLVDLYVFIDTGSTDGTEGLVRSVFAESIKNGRLVIEQMGPLPDYDISIARNRALDILKENKIDYVLKIDADDVFYDHGALKLVNAARKARPQISHISCFNHELYQWEVQATLSWLEALRDKRDIFWKMSFTAKHARAFRVEGSIAKGKWADEANIGMGENIIVPEPHRRKRLWGILGAHYGWARPVERKRDKGRIWYQNPDEDPRVERLHLIKDWRRPKKRFYHHPEVIGRYIDKVIHWIQP